MATRCRVGIRNDDGSVTSIYVHWDGGPENVAPILTSLYNTEERIRCLLELGDLKCLPNQVQVAEAFGTPAERHTFDFWPRSNVAYYYIFEPKVRVWYKHALDDHTWSWWALTKPKPHPSRPKPTVEDAIKVLREHGFSQAAVVLEVLLCTE